MSKLYPISFLILLFPSYAVSGVAHHVYVSMLEIQVYISRYKCLNGRNGVYGMYIEL
jgi:hypothetical protein